MTLPKFKMLQSTAPTNKIHRLLGVFFIFLRLGLTSFGGPVAHLGYFRHEFVDKRRWLDEHAYADLLSLCQFLPGPASSQAGIALGLVRAGYLGAIAAWIGFTLPSGILMILFGLGLQHSALANASGVLHGLKIAAVAVVAQALWQMSKTLCPDKQRASIAVASTLLVNLLPGTTGQVSSIIASGLIGAILLKKTPPPPPSRLQTPVTLHDAAIAWIVMFGLLIGLPVIAEHTHNHLVQFIDTFYQAGCLVFGGGHVVLPLLQASVVQAGWVTNNDFMAGYGAAQAVPGPLFSFAAYLGAIGQQTPTGWTGGIISLVAIFLPAFLLIIGAIPFWERIRHLPNAQRAMQGINASVVGILLSAFYHPVWTSAIYTATDFSIAITDLLLLALWKLPPWLVVLISAIFGMISNHHA